MKATISAVNKTKDGYSFLVDIEGRQKGFDFPEDVKFADVNKAVRDYLQEINAKQARLPELKKEFIGKVYEL
jgi:methionine salvage enolase-phosphatase E1